MEDKIALFAYNFPHKKTQDFIFRIIAEGYNIDTIYAADAVKLNIPSSTIKTKINHIGLIHPKKIAESLNINYINLPHNSEELCKNAKSRDISLGIISGARILKENTIKSFKKGIINFHPGIIPKARGLDALLWSILNHEPLGVTSHLVDKRVDAGEIIEIRQLQIFKTDTIFDLSERLHDIQLDMIATTIQKAINRDTFILEDYGNYNKKMPPELENRILDELMPYIAKFER